MRHREKHFAKQEEGKGGKLPQCTTWGGAGPGARLQMEALNIQEQPEELLQSSFRKNPRLEIKGPCFFIDSTSNH